MSKAKSLSANCHYSCRPSSTDVETSNTPNASQTIEHLNSSKGTTPTADDHDETEKEEQRAVSLTLLESSWHQTQADKGIAGSSNLKTNNPKDCLNENEVPKTPQADKFIEIFSQKIRVLAVCGAYDRKN